MTSAFEIRPGQPDEALDIVTLNVRAWRHAYQGVIPDAVLDALEPQDRLVRWRDRLADQGEHGQVWVVRSGGRLCGFCWFGPAWEHLMHPPPADAGEISAFYLDPDHFGGGLADRLAEQVEAWLAARFDRSVLWVLEDNARARRFYTRRGWLADGARTPYPRPGCRGVYVVRHRWVPGPEALTSAAGAGHPGGS